MLLRSIFLLSLLFPAHAHSEEMRIPPVKLHADLAALKGYMAVIHPDPGYGGQGADIARAFRRVEKSLSQRMTRDEAWRVMATLNPAFADAHMQVVVPDAAAQTRTHLNAGGKLFPFEVQLDDAGEMRIRAALGGGSTPHAGARITRINGVAAREVTQTLLARAAGDNRDFRANHLSWRMWLPYWKMYGAPSIFDIGIEGKGVVRMPGSSSLPESMAESFEQLFQFALLPDGTGLLTINAFMVDDEKRFLAFTRDVFAQLQASKARALIIDVRRNGGGDDGHWKAGILPYLANKPYRHTSSYVKKVILGRDSPGEPLGSLVRANHDKWEQPDLANPLRFDGEVYVLVGRMTYSSAVIFANVMQDFGFAKLVGERGYARTRQSGGTQYRTLPHTGLGVWLPRMVLERPAGPRAPALIEPDIKLPDDPFKPGALIDALQAWRKAQ